MDDWLRESSVGCQVIRLHDAWRGTITGSAVQSDKYTIRWANGTETLQSWDAIRPYGEEWERRLAANEEHRILERQQLRAERERLENRRRLIGEVKELFPFFYHLTHQVNLLGILEHGILSWTEVRARGLNPVDISLAAAQQWRENKEPVYLRKIHDYAPLYLNPKNPMLFSRREMQKQLVILEISPSVMLGNQYLYADGNAASHDTQFSTDQTILERSLRALEADYWEDFHDGKRRRCAEVLIHPSVAPRFIVRAVCNNRPLAEQVGRDTHLAVTVDRKMFF